MSDFRKFEPIRNASEKATLLKESVQNHSSVMLWTKNQSLTLNTHFTEISNDGKTLWAFIPPKMTGPNFEDHLAQIYSPDCFFSVSLLRANIFFRASFKGYDAEGLRFSTPEEIFKVQRRNDLRYPIPEGVSLRVELHDSKITSLAPFYEAIDISAGGVAIHVDQAAVEPFTTGQLIQQIRFRINGRDIQTNGEIRHLAQNPSDSRWLGTRVGIQFKNIKESDRQWIAAFVFEETRKMVSKFL